MSIDLVQRGAVQFPEREGVSVVEKNSRNTARRRKAVTPPVSAPPVPAMSMTELARLGGGKVAYIKVLTPDEAKELFPAVEGLPSGIDLYALHAADGTPLVLTDSHQAAVGHAMGDELEIAAVH
jgi:hypothetical protein